LISLAINGGFKVPALSVGFKLIVIITMKMLKKQNTITKAASNNYDYNYFRKLATLILTYEKSDKEKT